MLCFSNTTILLIQGNDVYLATVYFIDPKLICSPGRSQEEFEDQGVGNVLWLQKKDGTFVKAPLEMDNADEGVSTFLDINIWTQFRKHDYCLEMLEEFFNQNIFFVLIRTIDWLLGRI